MNNPLSARLATVRRRLRFVALVRGLAVLAVALLGGALLAGWLDYRIGLPSVVRAFLLVGIVGAVGWVGWRLLLAPLTQRLDDLSLALRIEQEYPILNDALASTVQFLQEPDNPATGSVNMKREAIQRSLRIAQGCDFNRIVATRDLRYWLPGAGTVLTLVLLLALFAPGTAWDALLRLGHPFGEHEWERDTQLALEYRNRIANGQTFRIVGKVQRRIPGPVTALVEFEGIGPARKKLDAEVKVDDAGRGTFVFAESLNRGQRDFRFRVKVGDTSSPRRIGVWHNVSVSRPPELASLNGYPTPQIALYPPEYTGLPSPHKLSPGTGQIECVAGTRVQLLGATSRPITQAWVEYKPAQPLSYLGAQIAAFGVPCPLTALMRHLAGKEVWDVVRGQLAPDGRTFSIHFTPAISGGYLLHIEDAEGLANDYAYDLRVQEDPVPIVNLLRPSGSQSVLPEAEIGLRVSALDEEFAVRTVWLEYRRKDREGHYLTTEPLRVPLWGHEAWAKAVPPLLAGLALRPLPIPLPTPELRQKYRLVEARRRWSLRGLVEEGDTLIIQACALDFNPLTPFPMPGRSHEVELKIVGKRELINQLEEAQARIQQELVRLREWQHKAVKNVIPAENQWRQTGKLRPEDVQQLVEAEQLQKQIQARVGDKNEGLRAEIDRLRQTVKENKLQAGAAQDRLELFQQELDRLAREHLQQIEPKLTTARQKFDNPENPKKPDPKQQGELGEARAHQEEVRQSLDELLKHLERWANSQQIKGKAHNLLQEQKELQAKAEKLQKDLEMQPRDPQTAADVQSLAGQQRQLGERMQKLVDEMGRVAREQADRDPKTAEKLEKAAKLAGEEMMLPQEMQDTADQLKRKQLNRAIKQQGESVKALQQLMGALEDKRADELERLVTRQKKEQDNLDEMVEKLEKLRKKVDEAKKIANPELRKDTLKKLAEEQRQLEEEARKKGRELARLRANQGARAMQEAAEQMKRAARQLDEGDDPEDAQQQAQEKLERAQDDLDVAQAEAEDELAREKLTKIADKIQGLKERQDRSVEESARIQRSVLQAGWTRGLAISQLDHARVQKGLAEETGSFAEKLKGAKVFEMILKRAGKNMEDAAQRMEERREKAATRVGGKLAAEELEDEVRTDRGIQERQKEAARRLQRLLDALKEELAKKDQPPEEQKMEEGEQKKDDLPGSRKGIPADGIPATAQLKALRAEQAEINERTKQLSERKLDPNNLQPEERAELEALQRSQDEVFQLLREIAQAANAANQGNNNPGNPKEGAKPNEEGQP